MPEDSGDVVLKYFIGRIPKSVMTTFKQLGSFTFPIEDLQSFNAQLDKLNQNKTKSEHLSLIGSAFNCPNCFPILTLQSAFEKLESQMGDLVNRVGGVTSGIPSPPPRINRDFPFPFPIPLPNPFDPNDIIDRFRVEFDRRNLLRGICQLLADFSYQQCLLNPSTTTEECQEAYNKRLLDCP